MSFLGSSLGQRVNASYAASLKISLAIRPSCLPNLDMPALIMLTSGFPFKPTVPLSNCTLMPSHNKNLQLNKFANRPDLLKAVLADNCFAQNVNLKKRQLFSLHSKLHRLPNTLFGFGYKNCFDYIPAYCIPAYCY